MWAAIDLGSFGRCELHFGRVDGAIQPCLTPKTTLRAGGPNKLQRCFITEKRLTGPIGADQRKHAMFNRVPLGSAGWEVCHSDRELELIRKPLEASFPAPTPITIGATAISLDQQPIGPGIGVLSAHQPPATQGRNRKFGGFMRGAYQYITTIVGQVVNAIRNGFAFGLAGKVMVVDLQSALPPGPTHSLEAPNQLLLFRIDANDRVAGLLKDPPLLVNITKLAIPFRVVGAGDRLPIALEGVVALP